MGVSRPAVAKWEAGKSSPDTTTLKLLADFFQVSSDFLLGRTDRKGKVSEAPAVQEVTNEAEESGELPIPEMLELRLRRRAEREGLTYREFVKRVLEKAVG
jgi:transcriptional regulator with XRE-family HTH domain